MKKFTKIACFIALPCMAFVVGMLAAPSAVVKYIHETYPGVEASNVRVFPNGVHMALHVEKPGLEADIPQVIVHTDGSVQTQGGTFTVHLDQWSSGSKYVVKGQRKISVRDAKVLISRNGVTATVDGTDYDSDYDGMQVRFNEARTDKETKLPYGLRSVVITNGHYDGVLHKLTAGLVTLDGHLPIEIPKMPHVDILALHDVSIWPNELRLEAGLAEYGPVTAHNATISRTGAMTLLRAEGLVLKHPWLGVGPLTLQHGVSLEAWDDLSKPSLLNVNGVIMNVTPETRTFSALGIKCKQWAEALPDQLAEPLRDIEWTDGDLSVFVRASSPEKVTIKHTCKAKCSSPMLKTLRKSFTYKPYDSKDARFERTSGPGSRDWVPISLIHASLPTAAIAMEDPGFSYHQGYISEAFENSLKDNLKLGKFLRGGSTITMQLAKNIWLYRDKTVSRKLQEILLAVALESCFTKDEILELYLNVVEFGPDLYGVGPAAMHYFHNNPYQITPEQAFYLAMLLPHPRKASPPDETTMGRVREFMKTMAKNHRISDDMLTQDGPVDESEWGQ